VPLKMNLFKKIFRLFVHKSADSVSRHFQNVKIGPKIYLNGKPYVKVRLRFVDTLDFDISKYIDQLEHIIESQKNEIDQLIILKEKSSKIISDLQTLNINLTNESRIKANKLKTDIQYLNDTIDTHNISIQQYKQSLEDLKSMIEFLNKEIASLQVRINSRDNKIGRLEQEIHWLRTSKNNHPLSKKDIARLKKMPDRGIYKIHLKNKELEDLEKTILILNQKEIEYQRKISDLEEKVKSITNK
jgi:chromosome segregation ATPase